MAPPTLPKRLSAIEVIEKCAGPKVDIYVGQKSKHYELPKDILCHYSKYFDRCFNGNFQEAQEQKLSLPDDDPEWFEILINWMFSGNDGQAKPKVIIGSSLKPYMKFVQYAEKCDLQAAASLVADDVFCILLLDRERRDEDIKEHIPIIFRVFPTGHKVRAQVARYCFKECYTTTYYEDEEDGVDGFAAEVLKQARLFKYVSKFDHIADPITCVRHSTASD